MKKSGFTLSEILITLVIIGIIAAITIPPIHAEYTEKERISKVKKTYAMFANAMTRVKADGGDTIFDIKNNNDEIISNWFNTYLKNYLITTKICYNEAGCWNEGDSYNLNGSTVYCNRKGIGIGTNIITAILNDGTFIIIDSYSEASIASYFGVDIDSNAGLIVFFDINGSKKPNTLGKDIFAAVWTKNGFVPAYANRTSSEIDKDCSSSGKGYSCIQKYLIK
ncbi:MAG: prepilin-type N-terminal cleavage/methylation domain-containing protein [Candidatus Gastranaerophilales bacterium]|nr:prepilin-type N-terminal cleavage/methylation domain-containing protein [Candidatus Gastranaerophilales bacterium]